MQLFVQLGLLLKVMRLCVCESLLCGIESKVNTRVRLLCRLQVELDEWIQGH